MEVAVVCMLRLIHNDDVLSVSMCQDRLLEHIDAPFTHVYMNNTVYREIFAELNVHELVIN